MVRLRRLFEGRPWYQLTTHFFRGLFDFGVLSDTGADAVRRLLIGIAAVMMSLGLLLTRMYLEKYSALSELSHDWGSGYKLNREPYHQAILGDGALVIAFPMVVVGIVMVLIGNSLFPTETDCRVLLPLQVPKRVVFVSKALAVTLFAGVFAIAAHVSMIPLVILMWNSRWSDRALSAQLAVHAVASLGASAVTMLVIMAAAGALLICVPRSRGQAAAMAFRGVALCAFLISIPLIFRLPATGALIAGEARLFYLVPPVWFVGVEQLLFGKGTPYFVRLAGIAGVAGAVSLVVTIGSYLFLYRRLERVLFRPIVADDSLPRRRLPFLRFVGGRSHATAATGPFIAATLRRSPLHQGVFVVIAAAGAALIVNEFVGTWHASAPPNRIDPLSATLVWAAFVLIFALNVAVRAALVLPLELRANWVFRITEDESTRAEELSTVVRTSILLGVVLPLAMLVPLEWMVLGLRGVSCMAIAALSGLVLVELHMTEWRRIPFTCSFEPSGLLAWQSMVIAIAGFAAFTTVGPLLAWYCSGNRAWWLILMTVLGAAWLYLRRQRLWLSRGTALMFEDVVPNEVEPLKLSEY